MYCKLFALIDGTMFKRIRSLVEISLKCLKGKRFASAGGGQRGGRDSCDDCCRSGTFFSNLTHVYGMDQSKSSGRSSSTSEYKCTSEYKSLIHSTTQTASVYMPVCVCVCVVAVAVEEGASGAKSWN